MLETVTGVLGTTAAFPLFGFLEGFKNYFLIFAGFSLVVFFHELGHFLAAKWCDVRVDKFAVGFGKELFGFNWGETRYSFNMLPIGGYVKMLGQDDFDIDKSGELRVKDDPRAFTHKPIGQRMVIVSAGVIMNLLFAAFVFMLVFMIGVDFPRAEIGLIDPESPAERGGLRVGDKILEINDQVISDFNDVPPAVMLSDPSVPWRVTVARAGAAGAPPTQMTFEIPAERNRDENKLQLGVSPPLSNKVASVLSDPAVAPNEQLREGDIIESINGQKVTDFVQINEALVRLRGKMGDLIVRRTGEDGKTETVHVKRRARMAFRPTGDLRKETGHLLGFIPRRQISAVNAGERADAAGLKSGDVIVSWGRQIAPVFSEIFDSIGENSERPIRVTVLRISPGGKEETVTTEVRPKGQGYFKAGRPKVGMDPVGQEEERLVVADIATQEGEGIPTPAASLKASMPRGSLITKVDGQPVRTWSELCQLFRDKAGKDVKLAWSYEGQPEQSGTMHVPQTLGTTFELPPDHKITKIDGMSSIEKVVDGRLMKYSSDNWLGARAILERCLGKTIDVEHRSLMEMTPQVEKVTVTSEMLDTWVQRVQYQVIDSMVTEFVTSQIRMTNPAKAMTIGLRKTYYFIEQVYMTMRRMIFTRSMGLDQVSGPIGIVKMGSDIAGQNFVKLLYFLALISANLAVINFLPLPIVDGGLFVFLIIEKIKGSPISIRVQVATQVIGLVLIIGAFLFVTIQDISKLSG